MHTGKKLPENLLCSSAGTSHEKLYEIRRRNYFSQAFYNNTL
ncbi:hypothetical protein HMPREF1990_00327 [Porphyromonas gingivalis W4087]|nr:hypothetical protein HMPREF1990_00327 [Porphyromonas gingivalis W4087]